MLVLSILLNILFASTTILTLVVLLTFMVLIFVHFYYKFSQITLICNYGKKNVCTIICNDEMKWKIWKACFGEISCK